MHFKGAIIEPYSLLEKLISVHARCMQIQREAEHIVSRFINFLLTRAATTIVFLIFNNRNSNIFTSILQIRYNIFICLITIVILSGGVTCKTRFVHKSTYQPPKARKVSFFCNWRMQMLHERGLVLHSTCRTQIYRGNNNYPVDA